MPSTKESRQAEKDREHEALKQKLADLEATMDQRVSAAVASQVDATFQERVNDAVASTVNTIMLDMVQSIKNFFANGQIGPVPVISLDGSNSENRPPTTHAQGALKLVTPPAGNAGAREDSPTVGVAASSPSVTCTPGLGPSTRAELDALEVIN